MSVFTCISFSVSVQDHTYNLPTAKELRERIYVLDDHRRDLERQLRNSRACERRARVTCQTLLKEVQEKRLIAEELHSKLEAYSGKL